MNSLRATIFAIKRYALHDGPNIRTTIFFKGCPLRCFWCHNPEGISAAVEVVTTDDRCIGCRECVHGCPEEALSISAQGLSRNPETCTTCLNCVEICPSLAHEQSGWYSDIASIVKEIEKDLPFYDQSGGGVTFSGGEPLLQADALIELLQQCGRLGIHRAVDTTGYAPVETLLAVARQADLVLYDLKHMDSAAHQLHTGVANQTILSNLETLGRTGIAIRVRIPLLSGINDDEKNIAATGAFAAGIGNLQAIDVLPYHHLASGKYHKLRQTCRSAAHHVPGPETIARVKAQLESYGHVVRIGG